MIGEWLIRDALVTVKAYPNPSSKYHETVCIAAVTREEGWIRLYPVQFRSMPREQQFAKYQVIQLRMKKHDKDSRPESYRPDEHSIEIRDTLSTSNDGHWGRRKAWIEPTLSPSICFIQREQKRSRKSLGAFKPYKITDLDIEDADPEWAAKKQCFMRQMLLFDRQTSKLEKIPFTFKYRYVCQEEGCKGHTQSIIDWEIMELYRNVRRSANSTVEVKDKIRQKYLDELCSAKRETSLFVGNHSLYPTTFMILGVFWPPKLQPSLFD